MDVLEATRGLGMENWLEVCSSQLSQISGFCKDACLVCPCLFFHGYRMDTNPSFSFKEKIINFSWNTESETLPHPVAGVCPLNVTTCPRACHLILCFLLCPPQYAAGRTEGQPPPLPAVGKMPTELISFLLHVLTL